MTENRALELDTAADVLAAVALCTRGPDDCPGRVAPKSEPEQPPVEPVMRRASASLGYRLTPPAEGRRYVCRFCRTEHVFPIPSEPAAAG